MDEGADYQVVSVRGIGEGIKQNPKHQRLPSIENNVLIYCEKHEIDNCSLCKPKGKSSHVVENAKPRFRVGNGIPAEFESICLVCVDDILVGDMIVPDEGRWIHKDCS